MKLGKPPSGYHLQDTERRRKWLHDHTGIHLNGAEPDAAEELKGIIENHVGYVPIPMGIASPLVVHGTYAQGEFAVPLCTVEGTLVLSMSRGMLATALSGGIKTYHFRQELTRSPFFDLKSVHDISGFVRWINEHYDEIKAQAESTTNHGRLLRIDHYPLHNWVVLDFAYDTSNAAGQNMVTLATDKACEYIKAATGVNYILESGFNSDKKPSTRNLMQGRGHAVTAEVTLNDKVLHRVLGIDKHSARLFQDAAPPITHMAGMLGCNLHVANALTAIYLATGQDAACVAENSVGHILTTPTDEGLYVRLTLPSLTVGTVGGGTRLAPQHKNLELLGCEQGRFSARKLAEIITAASLALEISLMAAIVSGTFASAHAHYGRK